LLRLSPVKVNRKADLPAGVRPRSPTDSIDKAVAQGIPVATFAIGDAGSANAGLFAVAMLALNDQGLAQKLTAFRQKQADSVRAAKLPELK